MCVYIVCVCVTREESVTLCLCMLCIVSSNLAFRTFEINTVKLTAFTKIAISVLNSCSYYDTVIVKALLSDIV